MSPRSPTGSIPNCSALGVAMRCPERTRQGLPKAKPRRCHSARGVAEFEEWAAMPGAERKGLEVRDMTEPECETSVVAEPTLVAEATEMRRLEVWDMAELERKAPVSELEHEAPVAEVTEVSRLAEEATVVELEAMVPQVHLRAGVP
jgi:hypothetical protein